MLAGPSAANEVFHGAAPQPEPVRHHDLVSPRVASCVESRGTLTVSCVACRQLNEIWPTGGWGSIEYGTPGVPGQVVGGRWKPLHYFLRKSAFADVVAVCGKGGLCFVKNDRPMQPFAGTVTVTFVPFRCVVICLAAPVAKKK